MREEEVERVVDGFRGGRTFERRGGGWKGKGKGEVFRYREFVGCVVGGGEGKEGEDGEGVGGK